MADKCHSYSIRLDWTGNQGTGTSAYRAYSRAHEINAQGKTAIAGSSDPVFRGDAARWNPAELLIAALSACHQLWYLHLCADAGIVILAYSDDASGVEIESKSPQKLSVSCSPLCAMITSCQLIEARPSMRQSSSAIH